MGGGPTEDLSRDLVGSFMLFITTFMSLHEFLPDLSFTFKRARAIQVGSQKDMP